MAEFATLVPVTLGAAVPLPGTFVSAAGQPEGVVTAEKGSAYMDTNTGAIWLKTSGSGATGWQPLTSTVLDVRAFGAVGDGVADDTAAIQAAIDAASAVGGGKVVCPGGNVFGISSPLVVPHRVRLSGQSRGATIIRALSGFTLGSNSEVITLGEAPTLAFGTRIENLSVDCNNIAGSVGIYSEVINELSGVRNVLVQNFASRGIHIRSNGGNVPQNYFLRDVELIAGTAASSASTIGILLTGSANILGIQTYSITSTGAVVRMLEAIRLDGTQACSLMQGHVENCTTGVVIGPNIVCSGTSVFGLVGNSDITTLVQVSNAVDNHNIFLAGLNKAGGTNVLVDSLNGNTLTNASLAFYAIGHGSPKSVTTSSGEVAQRFRTAVEFDAALDHDGGTVGFYGTTPVTQQTGVAVTAAAIHAALVNLGLITA